MLENLQACFYQFGWQIFFTIFLYKKLILHGHLESNAYGEYFFFEIQKKNFDQALKTIVPDVF